jgi:dTDP-4-dehydrorhamnose reductase
VLLEECGKRNIYWVHVGSGCIYQGDNGGKGFTEEDTPNFFGSFYSQSKAWIDQILINFPVLILRLRMPFDGTDHPRSLITKINKYDRVLDMKNSVTYLPDLLSISEKLIEGRKTGAYNIINPGAVSPYDIMNLYKEIVDPSHTFELLKVEDLPEVAMTGRSNCELSTEKLRAEGLEPPSALERIREALEGLKKK